MKVFFLVSVLCISIAGTAQRYKLSFSKAEDLQKYFAYRKGSAPIISGHRGSHIADYPENAVETFAYVLSHTPAFFEIDPRLTKDSIIVLLHDATLDRTTTGKGKLSDYTFAEVRKLQLKDKNGKVTPYRIPTLEEAIIWARGKTILNLDKKDVPPAMIIALIRRLKASRFVMSTVHTAAQAKFYFDDDPERMMSAFVKTEAELKTYEAAGLPWKNMIAYIGSNDTSTNAHMYELLHARGVRCMISAAPVYDKLPTLQERAAAYRKIIAGGADVLESDYPVEVGEALKQK
jgi:glycerophosphoryl diester phosphodiesterase